MRARRNYIMIYLYKSMTIYGANLFGTEDNLQKQHSHVRGTQR
jgi:hypothetical protein